MKRYKNRMVDGKVCEGLRLCSTARRLLLPPAGKTKQRASRYVKSPEDLPTSICRSNI